MITDNGKLLVMNWFTWVAGHLCSLGCVWGRRRWWWSLVSFNAHAQCVTPWCVCMCVTERHHPAPEDVSDRRNRVSRDYPSELPEEPAARPGEWRQRVQALGGSRAAPLPHTHTRFI